MNRLQDRIARAFGGAKSLHSGASPGTWFIMPSGHIDTTGVRDGLGNSAVWACLSVKARGFSEAPIAVMDQVQGSDPVAVPGHPMVRLLEVPNPFMVGELLWGYSVVAWDTWGSAYWWKRRSAAGRVVELWPLLPTQVEPLPVRPGETFRMIDGSDQQPEPNDFIGVFRYTVDGMELHILPDDMVYTRLQLDPDDHRHGAAPLKTVLREVLGDEEAGQFAAALLKNMGVPGVVLTPEAGDDEGPTPEQAGQMAKEYQDTFGGANRGKPFIPYGGALTPHIVAFSPEQMDFKSLRRLPEERISAATGVPAILAGLGAGLETSSGRSESLMLREFFAEGVLSPMWRIISQQLQAQLLPDFDDQATRIVRFDTTDVRALQEDKDKLFIRVGTAVKEGWWTVADARRATGQDVQPADDVYLRPAMLLEVPVDGSMADAEAAAALALVENG